jgi:hypothetical protein
MTESEPTQFETTLASRIASEDIRPGDVVSVLNEVFELPSFLWCCSGISLETDKPVRLPFMSRSSGRPFKVLAICLPFVYVKDPGDALSTFDTRRHQLVRLEPKTAKKVWKRFRKRA